MVLPFIQSYYLVLGAVYMFVPIMGRAGASIYPEVRVIYLFIYLHGIYKIDNWNNQNRFYTSAPWWQ